MKKALFFLALPLLMLSGCAYPEAYYSDDGYSYSDPYYSGDYGYYSDGYYYARPYYRGRYNRDYYNRPERYYDRDGAVVGRPVTTLNNGRVIDDATAAQLRSGAVAPVVRSNRVLPAGRVGVARPAGRPARVVPDRSPM